MFEAHSCDNLELVLPFALFEMHREEQDECEEVEGRRR